MAVMCPSLAGARTPLSATWSKITVRIDVVGGLCEGNQATPQGRKVVAAQFLSPKSGRWPATFWRQKVGPSLASRALADGALASPYAPLRESSW